MPIKNEKGEVVLFLVSHKDITDNKKDQDEEQCPETGERTHTHRVVLQVCLHSLPPIKAPAHISNAFQLLKEQYGSAHRICPTRRNLTLTKQS